MKLKSLTLYSSHHQYMEKLLSKCIPNSEGIIIFGSMSGSDLSASIPIIKSKLKDVLLETQKFDPNTQVD